MELFASQHPKAAETVERWVAHPRREVRRFADLLEAYWARAVKPVWPRVRAFLDADIAHRSRRLADGGPAAVFADLADGVTSGDRHVDVAVPRHEATIALGGRGLLLMPTAFSAVRPFVIDRAPWQPTLIYPARGIATLWEDAAPAPDGLARPLGATRATVLADLAAPRSTTQVAERLHSQVRCTERITTPGGPLEQEADWLRIDDGARRLQRRPQRGEHPVLDRKPVPGGRQRALRRRLGGSAPERARPHVQPTKPARARRADAPRTRTPDRLHHGPKRRAWPNARCRRLPPHPRSTGGRHLG
jgi:hypothetical protein